MNIQFESDKINQRQAQGLILLLQSLYPTLNNSQPVNSLAPTASLYYARINGVETEVQPTLSESASGTLSDPVQTQAGPTPVADAPKRTRRTKAEIAEAMQQAADVAAKHAATPAESTESQPTTEAQSTTKPITKEELTALASGFIQRHSMEDAFALLQSYGCGRINEVLALPTDKLNELAGKLNG